jgi:hypothetical protein
MPEGMQAKNHARHSSVADATQVRQLVLGRASIPEVYSLTRESTWSGRSIGTLTRRFQRNLDHTESLMQEAMQIAKDVTDIEANQTADSLGSASGKPLWHSGAISPSRSRHSGDVYPLPILHEPVRRLGTPNTSGLQTSSPGKPRSITGSKSMLRQDSEDQTADTRGDRLSLESQEAYHKQSILGTRSGNL